MSELLKNVTEGTEFDGLPTNFIVIKIKGFLTKVDFKKVEDGFYIENEDDFVRYLLECIENKMSGDLDSLDSSLEAFRELERNSAISFETFDSIVNFI